MKTQWDWIGADLDGTLAEWHGWNGSIGLPVPSMVDRVLQLIDQGEIVKIFTARIYPIGTTEWNTPAALSLRGGPQEAYNQLQQVQQWSQKYLGKILPVTCIKDPLMKYCLDDRAAQVIRNTGQLANPKGVELALGVTYE
jgi:hypothetical protein